jgi:hypothetical protein
MKKYSSILKLSIKSHHFSPLAHPLTEFHPLKSAICTTPQDWGRNSKSWDVCPKIGDGFTFILFYFLKQFKC